MRGRPLLREQRAAGQLELGPEVVQMPLQRVVERDALADQPLAVIDQQPQVELGPVQLRGRQRVQALAQRGAGDRERVDAVGLAALASARAARRPSAASGRARRARRARSGTAPSEPETCRQSSSAHTRSPPRPRAQTQQRGEPARADLDRLLAQQLAGRRRDRGDRVRALVGVRTEHDHRPRPPLTSTEADARRTRLAGGAATLLSSHAGHPRPATSDTTKGSQAQPGRQPERESARRRSGPSPPRRTSPTRRIQTASLEAVASAGACNDSRRSSGMAARRGHEMRSPRVLRIPLV